MARTSTLLLLLAASFASSPALAATMIKSAPAATATARPDAAADRPVLVIEQPKSQSNANRMLYDKLRTAARTRLTRFDVVEGSGSGDLRVSAEFLLEPTVEVDRKARTEEFERKDSSGKTVKDTRIVETIEYKSSAEADVRIGDSRSGTEDVLHVVRTGVSSTSTGEAREEAMDGIVRQILDALRKKHTLSAVVSRKDGRTVILDRGRNAGIEPDAYFAALGEDGQEIGEVRVERVERDRSVGRIRDGYYRIGEGTRLSEKLWGVPPRGLSIGVANRLLIGPAPSIDQTFLGIEAHLRQADPDSWFDLAVEADYLTRYDPPTGGVIPGFAVFGSFIPQVELVPEWLWLHAPLGLGLSTYWSRPVTGVDANATTLHLLAGAGATLTTPWHFRLSADGGVMMTPFPVERTAWRQQEGSTSRPVDSGVTTFTPGGLYAKVGLSFGF